jgi:hypothetical protein
MATDYGFLLGYAGYGKIGESNVRILSGNVMRTLQIPTANSFYSGTDNLNYSSDSSGSGIPISKIRLGYGVYSFNGNITLEITKAWLQSFLTSSLFQRTHSFNLIMNDGEQKLTLNGNVWSSISFNYAAQQIPTCSISFQSYNGKNDGGKNEDLSITSVTPTQQTAPSDFINYWESGISGMECESFNLTFNRQVTPVYLNGSGKVPSYIKASLTEMDISATCYDVSLPSSPFTINLGGVKIRIPNATIDEVLQNKSYNLSGLNSAGMRVFTLTGIRDSSTNPIFTIEPEPELDNKTTK